MATLAPFGFQAGQSRRSVNEYYVPASDTSTLAVGDPVKTNGDVFVGRLPDSRQSSGMLHVTKAASGDSVRGVIVGIVAGPGDNSAQSIPSAKTRAYTVLVNDNPQTLWDIQADNAAALSAMAGMYAAYTVGAPLGSVSSTVVDSSSIGSTVNDLLIAEVLRNDGANSLLRVAFVQHEMAAAGGSPQIGAQIQSLVSEAGEARTFARVVVFGDSIPGHNAIFSSATPVDPDGIVPPPWFVEGAVDHNWRGWGWISWIGPISMQRIQVVKSYCVQTNGLLTNGSSPTGQPLSTQVTRFLADRAAGRVKANRAIIHIGTNDNQFSIAACAAELLTQIARLGMPVDLVSSPPRGGTPTTVVGDGLQLWAWLQQWRATCKRIAEASGGAVRFIDAYALGNSPTTVPDVMAAGYTYDDIHTNSAYAFRIADAYVSSLLPSTLAGDLDLWPNNSNASSSGGANLIDQGVINPVFGTTSGGTGTGTVAGSYTITNVGTATHSGSVIANPNGIGNMQRIAITSNANNDGVNLATASFHAAGGTFLSAGDEAYLQCLVTIGAGGIFPKNMRLQLACFDGTTTWVRKLFDIDAAKEAAMPLTAARTLLLRTPKFVVPSGLTFSSVTGSLRPIFAAAGSCTIDVGNFECRRFRAGTSY